MLNLSKVPSQHSRWAILGASALMSCLALAATAPAARADIPLTRADIEAILNRVEFIPQGRSARTARLSDFMAIGDTLRTAAQSRAELRFNDGSLARVGERATFRFVPNTRNFRLTNGTMLLLIPPGRGRSTIQTPSAITGIQGSAVVVRYVEDRDLTIVMALTNNPAGPMTVTTAGCDGADCMTEHPLYAGQMAIIQDNQVQILEFDLPTFYQTSPLIDGLELNNPDPEVSLGPALDQVRAETLEALERETMFSDATVLNPALFELEPAGQAVTTESWFLSPTRVETSALVRPSGLVPPAGTLVGVPAANRPANPVGPASPPRAGVPEAPANQPAPVAPSNPAPVVTPPVATPNPPVVTPPVVTPPAVTPPAVTPPVATPNPPVVTPPVVTPPVVTPPVVPPPVATPNPPVVTPPVVAPPVVTPPVVAPPVVAPPVVAPPVVAPPVVTPPVVTPPVVTPPVVAPPVVTPPVVPPNQGGGNPPGPPGGVPAQPPPFFNPEFPVDPPANPPPFEAPPK
jgi:hypothetical protein